MCKAYYRFIESEQNNVYTLSPLLGSDLTLYGSVRNFEEYQRPTNNNNILYRSLVYKKRNDGYSVQRVKKGNKVENSRIKKQ